MKTIADRLTSLRSQKGVSQDVVAEACNISRVALTRYECGTRIPVARNMAKLAEYYGVSIDYLMGNDDNAAKKAEPSAEVDECTERIIHKLGVLDPENRAFIETLIDHAYEAKKNALHK